MIYVMILFSQVYSGWTPVTQEFGSRQACEAAAQVLNSRVKKEVRDIIVVCVPKEGG